MKLLNTQFTMCFSMVNVEFLHMCINTVVNKYILNHFLDLEYLYTYTKNVHNMKVYK